MLLYKYEGEPAHTPLGRGLTRRGLLAALGGLTVAAALPSRARAQQLPADEERAPFPYQFGDFTPSDPDAARKSEAERRVQLEMFLRAYGFYTNTLTTPSTSELQMLDVIYGLVRRADRHTTGAFTLADALKDLREAKKYWQEFELASPLSPKQLGLAIDDQIRALETKMHKK